MTILKIFIYLLITIIIIQIARQFINIIKSKQLNENCISDNKVINFKDTTINTLLIGDNTIMGTKLFDCNNTIAQKLSIATESNIYQFGNPDMTLKTLYDFIKFYWLEINNIQINQIIICIGNNDVKSLQFNTDTHYLDKTIKLLKNITDNIYILSPRDIHNDDIYVFPINYIIQNRVNTLYNIINSIANDNNITIIDIKKDLSVLCKNGKYCRLSDRNNLDNDGITIITNLIRQALD